MMRADDLLRTAAEQFLGVPVNQLKSTVNQTLEGHLRAILGKFCHVIFFRRVNLLFLFTTLYVYI